MLKDKIEKILENCKDSDYVRNAIDELEYNSMNTQIDIDTKNRFIMMMTSYNAINLFYIIFKISDNEAHFNIELKKGKKYLDGINIRNFDDFIKILTDTNDHGVILAEDNDNDPDLESFYYSKFEELLM